MTYINYIIQLIAEFFPISSTLLLETINLSDDGLFHIFSGLILIIIFYKKIFSMIIYPLKNFKTILNYIIVSIPSIIIGLIINYGLIKWSISYQFQIITNIIMGIILYMTIKYFEKNYKHIRQKNITTIDSILLGVSLSLNGIFPGMSRLGTSLTFLLFRGYSLERSYSYSMFTSIPIIIGKPLLLLIKEQNKQIYLLEFCKNYYFLIILSFISGFFFYKIINYYLSLKILKIFIILRILFFLFIGIVIVK